MLHINVGRQRGKDAASTQQLHNDLPYILNPTQQTRHVSRQAIHALHPHRWPQRLVRLCLVVTHREGIAQTLHALYRKVVFVLEELGLTYESVYLDFQKGEHKAPEFTKYNPNGRIPAIIDHKNGDFVIWESNAIILYLVEKYDTEQRLTVGGDEKHLLNQWLFFQASGQG